MDHTELTLMQARQLLQMGLYDQALAAIQSGLAAAPDHADLHDTAAIIFAYQGRPDEALPHAQSAVRADPGDPAFLTNLGHICVMLRRHEEAASAFQAALSIAPDTRQALIGSANALTELGRVHEALASLGRAIELQPDDPSCAANYALLLFRLGKADEAAAFAREALHRMPTSARLAAAHAFVLNYVPGVSPEDIFHAHQAYGRTTCGALPPPLSLFANRPDPDRILRIGFVSPDFRSHSVAFFIEPFLKHFDRVQFHVICYASLKTADRTTLRLQELASEWRSIIHMHDAAAADAIRADGVDILVDLAGLTSGNRLGIFLHRPAPIQATYLGYPSTTGLPCMDYRIVDPFTDPPGAERWCVENIVRISPSFLCYAPISGAPPVVDRSGVTDGVVFGSFNAVPKLNVPLFRLWKSILDAVPGSSLLIKTSDPDSNASRGRLEELAREVGLHAPRMRVLPRAPSIQEHLAEYGRVDIALDSFPYNGTTTTFEALYMGAPVIALAGDRHASRVGLSILSNLGLARLVAESPDAYVQLAIHLARDADDRRSLRTSLRDRLLASPLCDAPTFARRLGDALRSMWRAWCAAQPPG